MITRDGAMPVRFFALLGAGPVEVRVRVSQVVQCTIYNVGPAFSDPLFASVISVVVVVGALGVCLFGEFSVAWWMIYGDTVLETVPWIRYTAYGRFH